MDCLTRLGRDVEIVIKEKPHSRPGGRERKPPARCRAHPSTLISRRVAHALSFPRFIIPAIGRIAFVVPG